MIKALIKNKLRIFNGSYENMKKSRKILLLAGIFIAISILLMETFMFPSVDKFNKAKEDVEGLETQKANLGKEKEAIVLKNAYKTEKSLLKQKNDIIADIDKMLKSNDKSNYIPSEEVSKLIENIVKNIGQVKVVSFKNIPDDMPTDTNSNILIKHNFNIKITGSFQGIYDVLTSLESIKGINISMVEINKETPNSIAASFNFYVMNTNKNILNF